METVGQWEALLKSKGALADNQTIDDYSVRMALWPVDVTTKSTYGTLLSVSNYILPTVVRLHNGDQKQKMQIIYTLEGSKE